MPTLAEALTQLSSSDPPSTLDLLSQSIDAAGAATLAEALKVCCTTVSYSVSVDVLVSERWTIGHFFTFVLVYFSTKHQQVNTSLTTLDLQVNTIDVAGATAVAEALKVSYGVFYTWLLMYGQRALTNRALFHTFLLFSPLPIINRSTHHSRIWIFTATRLALQAWRRSQRR
jgi:F0F1-type ATP synthase assembly protein I